MEALGTREAHRADARREHGIGEDAAAIDLEEGRAVPEPRDPQAGVDGAAPRIVRAQDRERGLRDALPALEQPLADDRWRGALELGALDQRVAERAVAPLSGGANAFESKAVHWDQLDNP